MENTEILMGFVTMLVLLAYAFHILIITYGWMKLKGPGNREGEDYSTRVSIVIAMRNEKDTIPGLISGLKALNYPREQYEAILVDDYSSDGSYELAGQLIRDGGLQNFKTLSLEMMGVPGSKKEAIATGVSNACGELVLLTDADCRFGEEWLKAMVSMYDKSKVKMITGPVAVPPGHGFGGLFHELEFISLAGTGAGSVRAGMPIFCNGANMAFSRQAFEEAGGYAGNERFSSGDDVFLLHKIKKRYGSRAIRYVLDPEAMVSTSAPGGWKDFLKQRFRWASKTKGYKDLFSLTTASAVFFINLLLLLLLVFGIFRPPFLLLFGYLFMMKMMIDFPILAGAATFYKRKGLLWWFPLFEMVYIPYVVLAGGISLFHGGKWKGRKVGRG